MKRLLTAIAFCLAVLPLAAQNTDPAQAKTDSLNQSALVVDTDLLGKDILTVIGPGVTIMQSESLKNAFNKYVRNNATKPLVGYRIRVYFESGQYARGRSASIAAALKKSYPTLGIYQSFESPYFQVFLGDFRTRHDAMPIFNEVKAIYPTALLMRQNINYPR